MKTNQKAYDEAIKQLEKDRIKEVKEYILETLEKLEKKKKEKARTEEEIRVLKKDLEDLRNGNFDKIRERKQKSEVSREVSVDLPSVYYTSGSCVSINATSDWLTATQGTYSLSNGTNIYF